MEFLSDRRLEKIDRAVSSGRIIPYLAFVTFAITLSAALVVWLFARGEFGTFGESVWWAAQTVTTVGYGDVVPETAFSKVIAVVVMLFGVAAVALITAVATSAVVTRVQRRHGLFAADEALARIEARLEAIERRLG